jgi:ABC-type transport system involved in cytochrome bd biosynthesis fused ATPase/permease subunit
MSSEANAAQARTIRIVVLIVGVSLGVITAGIAVNIIDIIVGFAIAIILFLIVVLFFAYWFRRTHTREERAALAAESQLRRDRIKFARGTTKCKREVLRTGAEARAAITAVGDLRHTDDDDWTELVYLELAVTVGADAPYAVCTGEYIGAVSMGGDVYRWRVSSLAVGRELVVRVDLTDRQRVAVDWKKSLKLRQA